MSFLVGLLSVAKEAILQDLLDNSAINICVASLYMVGSEQKTKCAKNHYP